MTSDDSPFTPPRQPPAAITATFLTDVPDDALEDVLYAYVCECVDLNELSYDSREFRALPPGLRAHFASCLIEAEVSNGGFTQLFLNATGEFAPAAADAFEAFGVPQAAALVREALRVRTEQGSGFEKARAEGTLEASGARYHDEPFGPLNEAFWDLAEKIRAARRRYIRTHSHAFIHARGTA